MTEWEHKERNWSHRHQDDLSGQAIQVYEEYYNGDSYDARPNSKFKIFTEWLDWQCEQEWEVFKISRDFNGGNGTWCIFRKKTE